MFRRVRILSAALFVASVAVFALAPIGVSAAVYLPRDLRRGDTGLDVYNLQVLLNADPATAVAASGAGSSGQETQNFGPATEAAVKKFQAKHAETVLAPIGISAPTGFVGARTRAALDGQAQAAGGSAAATASVAESASSLSGLSSGDSLGLASSLQGIFGGGLADAPALFPAEGQPTVAGAESYLMGHQFAEGGTYLLVVDSSGKTFATATAVTDNMVTFVAPKGKDWVAGQYKLHAEGTGGVKSNTVTVYLSDEKSPRLTRISPSPMPLGAEITIEGENFAETGNSVVTSSGVISGLAGKGGKIKFRSNIGSQIPKEIRGAIGGTSVVVLRVINANGASTPVMLNVSF